MNEQNELTCPHCGDRFTSLRARDLHIVREHRYLAVTKEEVKYE